MNTYEMLKQVRKYLSSQQYKTIKGQIKAGDVKGACKGIENLMNKLDKKD